MFLHNPVFSNIMNFEVFFFSGKVNPNMERKSITHLVSLANICSLKK